MRFWNEKPDCGSFNLPLHFLQKPWYTVYEVRDVQFRPFVYDAMNRQVPVAIEHTAGCRIDRPGTVVADLLGKRILS